MSEQPKEFKSFGELPTGGGGNQPIDKERPVSKIEKKKDPEALGRMLLQQMGLLVGENLETKEGEKMPSLEFFKKAIKTGWINNPRKKAGDTTCWGPIVMDAYKLYFGEDDRSAEKALEDAMRKGEISYIPEKNGKGYMLKIVRLN